MGLFEVGWPPRMDRGAVLPEFADAGAFPSAPGFRDGKRLQDEVGKMRASVGSDGFSAAIEGEAGSKLIGDHLEIWRALEGQEGDQEFLDLQGPSLMVIASRDAQGEAGSAVEPGKADAEKVCAADEEKLAGVLCAETALVERVEG